MAAFDVAVVGAGSRLTQITVHGETVVYTYDAAGNVTRRQELGGKDRYLYWNALGQLDSVKTITGTGRSAVTTVSRYRYDAFGQRIRVQDGSQVLESMWVDGHVLFDVEGSTATEYAYFTGTDRPHSMRRNGQTYHYLTDHLGSVVAVVDSAGITKNSCTYDPWGYGSCSEQVGNRLRYTGREYDGATGFYYLRARYYDPATGRFLSEDPLGVFGGLKPYAYAGNNPLRFRDPSGLTHCDADVDIGEPFVPPDTTTVPPGEPTYEPQCDHRRDEAGLESPWFSPVDLLLLFVPGLGEWRFGAGLLRGRLGAKEGAFLVGTAGRAALEGAVTPAGLVLSKEAAARLAGRLEGRISLSQLDAIVSGPGARAFTDATTGTIRVFNTSVTEFGGSGLNVIINPQTRTIVTVFPSDFGFIKNTARFTPIGR